MRDVRIGIVSDYYYPQLGGITEHVHGQASELARRGHDVTVLTPRLAVTPSTVDGHDLPARNFDVVRVGRAFPFYANGAETLLTLSPSLPLALDRLYRRHRFDVVHVHNPFGAMLPYTAIVRSRAPATVGTFHSVVPERYRPLLVSRPLLRRVFRRLGASISVPTRSSNRCSRTSRRTVSRRSRTGSTRTCSRQTRSRWRSSRDGGRSCSSAGSTRATVSST